MLVVILSEDLRFVTWVHRIVVGAGWTARYAPDARAHVVDQRRGAPRPDLVITDLGAVALGEEPGRSLVDGPGRVVVVTPRWDERTHEAVLAAGADAFVPCPVGDHELVARLRAVVRRDQMRPAPRPTHLLEAGDLVLDLDGGAVVVGRARISLRPVEVELLAVLVERAPRVVAHAHLEATVRDVGGTGVRLDPILRRLRGHLEVAEGWRRIEAVRGVGYRLLVHRPPVDRLRTFTATSADGHGSFDRRREPVEP